MSYTIKQLTDPIDSEKRHEETRKIFLDLKEKAVKGGFLTEHEKNFLYDGIRYSFYDEGNIADYPDCENPIFKDNYLWYYHDLTGGSKYYKPHKGKAVEVSIHEARKDLNYLIAEAKRWLVEIEKTNHSDQLMQQLSKETREQKKVLDNTPEIKNDPFAKGRFFYKYKLWSLLLNSKFVYLVLFNV